MDKTITVMVVEDILSARETVINLLRAFSNFRLGFCINGLKFILLNF